MSIFDNSNFLSIQPLDFENKFYQPTARLYVHVKQLATEVYQQMKDSVIGVHNAVSNEAMRVYEHPGDRLSEWYQLAMDNGSAAYQAFFPEVVASCQHLERYLTDLGFQSKAFWTSFQENPETVAVSIVEPLLEQFSVLMTHSQIKLSLFAGQMEGYVLAVYSNVPELFARLLQQPVNTINAVFQNALAALLEAYAQAISSLLVLI